MQSEEIYFAPGADRIVSVWPLATRFISRWFFDHKNSNDLVEIDRLSGLLSEKVAEEVLQRKYPMIPMAHATCEQEEPLFDPNADQETPLIYNAPQLTQMNRWQTNLRRRLRQAVELELKRFQ